MIQPPFPQFLPESNWVAPRDFPNLESAKEIYYDLETYDPFLKTKGPGSFRRDGFITGYAIGVDDQEWYFPVRHSGGNVPLEPVQRWLRHELSRPHQPKITAYGGYDREWSIVDDISIAGTVYDVQIAEALIDEEKDSYKLDSLALEYLGEGKEEDLLNEAASWWVDRDEAKKIMHLMEARHVGPYATGDIRKTRGVWKKQVPRLRELGIWDIFQLESELSEVVFKMRQQGVCIDEEACHRLSKAYGTRLEQAYYSLRGQFFKGQDISFMSGEDLARVCDNNNIPFLRTKAGNPTFTKEWLSLQDHPFLVGVREYREEEVLKSKFIDNYFLSTVIKGKLHAEFTQTATEEGGARYGRFACRNPPLQQTPKRGKRAKEIRSVFLPFSGKQWCKCDYSQQEYRMVVHYAMLRNLPGAKEAGQFYIDDENADYHSIVAKLTGLDRGDAKNTNFAKAYGSGVEKFARMIKKSVVEAKRIMEIYDAKAPYVKELSKDISSRAAKRGFIRTIGGRVLHFNKWEPYWAEEDEDGNRIRYMPLAHEEAIKKWPNVVLKRGGTHKAMNRLIQGGSGDQTKMAMLKIYKEYGFVPMMQLHDELDYSVNDEKEGKQIKEIMEHVIELLVPSKVDMDITANWGGAK